MALQGPTLDSSSIATRFDSSYHAAVRFLEMRNFIAVYHACPFTVANHMYSDTKPLGLEGLADCRNQRIVARSTSEAATADAYIAAAKAAGAPGTAKTARSAKGGGGNGDAALIFGRCRWCRRLGGADWWAG